MKIRWETEGFPDFPGIPEARSRLQLGARTCYNYLGAVKLCMTLML